MNQISLTSPSLQQAEACKFLFSVDIDENLKIKSEDNNVVSLNSSAESFLSRLAAEEEGSPTPKNAQPLANDSPIISIPSPVANLNPFTRSRGGNLTSRPCLAGTQSLAHPAGLNKQVSPTSSFFINHADNSFFVEKSLLDASNTSGICSDYTAFSSSSLQQDFNNNNMVNRSSSSFSDYLSSLNLHSLSNKEPIVELEDKQEKCASMIASSTASSILNNILLESSSCQSQPPYELDDNILAMSKYVEELTGFPQKSIPSRSFNPVTVNSAAVSRRPFPKVTPLGLNENELQTFLALNEQMNCHRHSGCNNPDLSLLKTLMANNERAAAPSVTSLHMNHHQHQQAGPSRKSFHETGGSINSNSSSSLNLRQQLYSSMYGSSSSPIQSPKNGQNSSFRSLEMMNEKRLMRSPKMQNNRCLASSTPIRYNNNNRSSMLNDTSNLLLYEQLSQMTGGSTASNNSSPACSNFLSSDVELAATSYRNSASSFAQRNNDVSMKWTGELPIRNYQSMSFSRKVFLGGVPWEATSDVLSQVFCEFGQVHINWPQGGDSGMSSSSMISSNRKPNGPKGYCYLIFESEHSVSSLLSKCRQDMKTGEYFFSMISLRLMNTKEVQVIPWILNDSQFGKHPTQRQESTKTVFIGALHGMITASALALIFNSLFGNVVYAAIDTDKYKYPIGSGRVVFSNLESYYRAVSENFIEVRTSKFNKIIQVDPYLEDALCSKCCLRPGIYFCRAWACFSYFCPLCWSIWHNNTQTLFNHKPLRRSWRQNQSNDNSCCNLSYVTKSIDF